MALTIYESEDVPQGSDAWLAARAGLVTASTIGKLITPSTLKPASNDTARSLIETLVIESITGRVEYVHPNAAMQRGNRDEPWARHEYEKATGQTVTEVGFIRLDTPDYSLGYSPDGLVGDDGLTEFKSRTPRIQARTIITGEVPLANMAQLMTGLYVTRRDWIDYASYSNGMPLFIKRVYPDGKWFDAIDATMRAFTEQVRALRAQYETAAAQYHQTEYIDHDAEEEITF